MIEAGEYDSYSAGNLVVVTAASCLSTASIIFLFTLFVWGVSEHHPNRIPTNSGILLALFWVVAANFLTAVGTLGLRRITRRLPPSWLIVPIAGTVFYVLSFWLFTYLNSLAAYSSVDPFSMPPPSFTDVLVSAGLVGTFLTILAILVSFAAFDTYSRRDAKTELHLE